MLKADYAIGAEGVKRMDTKQLHRVLLIEKIFEADKIHLTPMHYGRNIAGGIKPVNMKNSVMKSRLYKREIFFRMKGREYY